MKFKNMIKVDPVILITLIVLLGIGLIFIYNSSFVFSNLKFKDQYFFVKRQGLAILFGMSCLIGFSMIPYKAYFKFVPLMIIVTIISLGLLYVPGLGVKVGGATRWLKFPFFNLQVSEFAKIVMIFYLASIFSKKTKGHINNLQKGILPLVVVCGAIVGLILMEPDFGTAFTILVISFFMFVVCGIRFRHILGLFIVLFPIVYYLIFNFDYRKKRILSFLNPWADPQNSGFQIIQSFVAFQNGGINGVGLGEGKQALLFLPEVHTDFIFSVIGEELGFIGACLIIFLFLVLISRTFLISLRLEDKFGSFLIFGMALMISIQVIFNLGVVTALLPTKGLPLPFISYGGSSLIANLICMGIILNASKEVRNTKFILGV
ncbi:MAG: putative lipid II flippase FtsW [Pseudomonadota bacterium]